MANTRVSDLAKKYGVPSKEVIGLLGDLGEFVKAPSSGINPLVEKRFNDTYGADLNSRAEAAAAKKAAKKAPARPAAPTPGPAASRTPSPSAPAEDDTASAPAEQPAPSTPVAPAAEATATPERTA
ncbi:translation initiation factor IF-2 N-terminal domain-containing protein, partial [Nocardioides korecus]